MEIQDSVWVHKYRPKKLDDLVLPERYIRDFRRMIERQSINNLMFSGPPGGGKTTLARILCSKEGLVHNPNDNLLTINGSAKSTRGIKIVDDVIVPFIKIPPAADRYKVVFVDEADNMTPDAFKSLRGYIEKALETYGRFIFTCNFPSKIPDALHSRFDHYKFQQIPKEFILKYSKGILDKEKIEHEDKDVMFVIDTLYPDVRKIINALQRCSWDGKLDADEKQITTAERVINSKIVEIVSCIEKSENQKIGKLVVEIIEILKEQEVEYSRIYSDLFFMEKFPAPAKIVVNKFSNEHQGCLVPTMHLTAMVYAIIKTLNEYKRVLNVPK